MMSRRLAALVAILAASLSGTAFAQPPAPPPTTAVLVNLTIKPDVDRAQVTKTMPDEVRATVQLYLDGKIQQWYARGDGRGVVFILNSMTIADAKTSMESLPLSKSGLVNLDYTALGPLTPLRALIAPAAEKR
jgi:peptidyl-tRNA hydrolase